MAAALNAVEEAIARSIRGGGLLPLAKARQVMAAIPDGWAKIGGEWVELELIDTGPAPAYLGEEVLVALRL